MAVYKKEIIKLGETTILSNSDIAKIVGCSVKTVNKHIGSHSARCRAKAAQDAELFEIQKTVLMPDIHYPHCDEKLMESLAEFIVDYTSYTENSYLKILWWKSWKEKSLDNEKMIASNNKL